MVVWIVDAGTFWVHLQAVAVVFMLVLVLLQMWAVLVVGAVVDTLDVRKGMMVVVVLVTMEVVMFGRGQWRWSCSIGGE